MHKFIPKHILLIVSNSLVKFTTFLLITIALCCCNDNEHKNYPPNLTKAIDLFFLENRTDEVISLLNELDTAKLNPNTKLLADIYRIGAICEDGKPDSALKIFQKLPQKTIRKNSELNYLYNCLHGLILFRTNKFTESYSILVQTINFPTKEIRANALNERILARISFALGDYSKGIDLLLQSSHHFALAGLTKSVAINHKILGRQYMNSENYSQALISFEKAQQALKESKDSLELFYIYINYVDYYIVNNDLKKAQYYANLCLHQCEKCDDNNMITLLYNNMGEIEYQLKNYNKAVEYFNKTLSIPADYPLANVRHAYSHINLSKIYKTLNRNDLSLYHAKSAASHYKQNNDSKLRYKVYKNLAENYYDNQSILNAYKNLDTAYQNMDSVNISLSATAKAYYDSKVELINVSNNIQELKIREQKQRLITIGIAFILVFVLILGFIYYRLLNSRNTALKALVNKNLQIIEDERKRYSAKLAIIPKKNGRKLVESEKSEIIFNQFLQWLEIDNNFTRKDLTLESIAKEMNTNREYLSQAINENNLRFTDIINKIRILKAIEILSDKKNPKSRYNLSVIAHEVGFNSNSVFIEAFRKQTGMNPAQFRDNLQDKN